MLENETKNKVSALKAIRLNCLQCSGNSSKEVKLCVMSDCPLYPFRFGKNPFRPKVVLSDEKKQIIKERLIRARENKKNV